MTMESPKKRRSKWRLFRCFKSELPVDDDYNDDDAVLRKAKSADPLFSYVTVADRKRASLRAVFMSSKSAADDDYSSRRKKMGKENHHSVRRALMSALHHTSLGQKLSYRRKTSKKDGFTSQSSSNLSSTYSSLQFASSTLSSTSTYSSTPTNTETSPASTESHLCTSWLMNGNGVVAKQKQNIGDSTKGNFGNLNMGMLMFFITILLVMIMWGRCCAIVYTSTGLFVMPNRWRRPCNKGVMCEESDFSASVRFK